MIRTFRLFRVSQSIKSIVEIRKETGDLKLLDTIQDYIQKAEYKQFPYDITHYDPEHPDYIPSERDDYQLRLKVDKHNYFIDKMKQDVKIQQEVDAAIQALDRPYLRGKPGIDRNVTGGLKDYFVPQVKHNQMEDTAENLQFKYSPLFRNEKRWIAQTIIPRQKTRYEIEFQDSFFRRPVNRNFHPDKGSKFDIITPYEQRFPHVADRLGHPEFLANPVQRLLRLESDIYHPVYNDQPFVQSPPTEPDMSLNFEEGEVIYENARLVDWLKLETYSSLLVLGWFLVFMPIQNLYKSNLPTDAMLENNYYPYHMYSIHNFDYMKIHVAAIGAGLYYALLHLIRGGELANEPWVAKMQYNKDKELIFVTKVSGTGFRYEKVYEAHHIEVVPMHYSILAGNSQYSNGYYAFKCLNTGDELFLSKKESHWNPKIKKQFISDHSQLIDKQILGLKRTEMPEYVRPVELITEDLPVK